ncbi:MAG: prepilin-type N-terminal cleavage/methylation domain-containing protein [Rubrobacteraceae bacterium]|uniref:type IV pilus modification PilV family protein n=1 Tax=Rubrobacter naiadicus TaxID=1392641 RepID=UPI0023606C12|nr:prepilin-type N-terminal cleavage/methylation domain-containing protein [Rubrobacter naiadicus]MBX6764338.1 prepilin-type N-terminal cleavage/methylation domain-containing protein [Rubrobacteraceae bacterium]MCL6438551.1 prepilin-type N-terminal cleavage/methylation domain-containing protein [Rubrobacteraceae bacterium]
MKEESGYTMIEVLVSILLLSIAIIPMAAMFDTGLKTALLGGNYDRARALAQKELAQAQVLYYPNLLKESSSDGPPLTPYFPDCAGSANAPAAFDSSGLSDTTGCTDPNFSGMTYEVKKQFLKPPDDCGGDLTSSACDSSQNLGLMRITIIVRWGDGHAYEVQTVKASS